MIGPIQRYRLHADKLSPARHRLINFLLILVVAIAVFVLLFIFGIPAVRNLEVFQTMNTGELVAMFALMTTIVITSINLISASMNKTYSSRKQLSLEVSICKNMVLITSAVENKGVNRITPRYFYLFIDECIEDTTGDVTRYIFPHILKHTGNDFDCILSLACSKKKIESLPTELISDQFKEKKHICYVLQHISPDSVNFIDPGESFSEDALFVLEAGVYRVILVGFSEEADCMCVHKMFVVERAANENIGNRG